MRSGPPGYSAARSEDPILLGPNSSEVEHFLGKEEVSGSIPDLGSSKVEGADSSLKWMGLRELSRCPGAGFRIFYYKLLLQKM